MRGNMQRNCAICSQLKVSSRGKSPPRHMCSNCTLNLHDDVENNKVFSFLMWKRMFSDCDAKWTCISVSTWCASCFELQAQTYTIIPEFIRLVRLVGLELGVCVSEEREGIMPSPQQAVSANAETVGTAIGRMAIGLGIGAAGAGIGIGIAVGLYYVGRGLERAGAAGSYHSMIPQHESPPPPKTSK